jgi:hypothetical protein
MGHWEAGENGLRNTVVEYCSGNSGVGDVLCATWLGAALFRNWRG